MKKMLKILKGILIGLISLILILTIGLLLAIPISKSVENEVQNPGQKFEKWVLTGVNVVDIKNNEIQYGKSLFMNRGHIENIVPDSLADYSGYHQIAATNQYISPGLIDMHAHAFDRTDLTQYLSHGVTTIRNMMGFPMHLRWKTQLAQGDFVGSRLITAGPTLNNEGHGGPFHKGIATAEEAKAAILSIKNQGYDFIKIYDGITSEQMNTIMETASELNMQVVGHPPRFLGIEELAESKMRSIEHVEELFQGLLDYKFDEDAARKIAKVFAENNVKVCVTLSAYHQIYLAVVEKQAFIDEQLTHPINPFLKFIGTQQMAEFPTFSPEGYNWTVKKYKFMERLVKILDEEGVTLLFGTDTGPSLTTPGQTVHEEMQLLKQAGLSNSKILKSATIDAAMNLGLSAEIGSIEVGKRAEFILIRANPLEDLKTLSEPNAIIYGEQYYDVEAVKTLRGLGENKQGWYVTLGNFLEHLLKK
jgi:imidazolonepropionase-like amidohydrolase